VSRATRTRLTLFLAAMAWLGITPAAHAYIDPGSTSMIFSAIVAGLAAAGTVIGVYWQKFKRLFRRGGPELDTYDWDDATADRTPRRRSTSGPDATVADAAAGRVAGSFRDRAGFVFERDGVLYRQVNRSFAGTWDAVVDSGLYDALHTQGLLVAHEVVDTSIGTDDAHVVIRPDRIPFVSFPYEWSPGQLRDAALLTLRIQDVAIEHGMTLRDASAYNVQFRRGRPVFIDTLSFAPWEEGTPWVAYGQFCEQFLARWSCRPGSTTGCGACWWPMSAVCRWTLRPRWRPSGTKLKPGLLTHLHMHARARSDREVDPDAERKQARFSRNAMVGLIRGLRKSVEGLTWDPSGTTWADYDETAQHYDDQARRAKTHAVKDAIDRVEPDLVWDLGANTGGSHRWPRRPGPPPIAFDLDAGAVERGWQRVSADPPTTGDVLPLVLDLANPSPALGWAQRGAPVPQGSRPRRPRAGPGAGAPPGDRQQRPPAGRDRTPGVARSPPAGGVGAAQ
jgi:hypothetical protein